MNKTYTMTEVLAELVNRLPANVGSKSGKETDGSKNDNKAGKFAGILAGLKRH